jgi:hypothetical protein
MKAKVLKKVGKCNQALYKNNRLQQNWGLSQKCKHSSKPEKPINTATVVLHYCLREKPCIWWGSQHGPWHSAMQPVQLVRAMLLWTLDTSHLGRTITQNREPLLHQTRQCWSHLLKWEKQDACCPSVICLIGPG